MIILIDCNYMDDEMLDVLKKLNRSYVNVHIYCLHSIEYWDLRSFNGCIFSSNPNFMCVHDSLNKILNYLRTTDIYLLTTGKYKLNPDIYKKLKSLNSFKIWTLPERISHHPKKPWWDPTMMEVRDMTNLPYHLLGYDYEDRKPTLIKKIKARINYY